MLFRSPFVLTSGDLSSSLGFKVDTVSLNGNTSTADAVQSYDVYYYNENLRTVWVYRNRVTGVYTAAQPSLSAPSSVTVSGVNYSPLTTQAAFSLSDIGELSTGDTVTLLLGAGGEVVMALSGEKLNEQRIGIVQSIETVTRTNEYGVSTNVRVAHITCADGLTYQEEVGTLSLTSGTLVGMSVQNGKVTVKQLSSKKATGKITADAVGGLPLAPNANIADVTADNKVMAVSVPRISGVQLGDTDTDRKSVG